MVADRNCPICGAHRSLSKMEVRAQLPAETLGFDELREYFIGFRSGQCFFTYFRCQCGLLWCPTYFSEKALEILYASMPENTSVSGERDSTRTQDGYAKAVARFAAQAVSIVEIGADNGSLLEKLSVRIPEAELVAVEPNTAVHPMLETRIGKRGRVFRSLHEIEVDSPFDLSVAIHVMDHVLDPVGELRALTLKGSDTMRMFMVVHDESSLLRRVMRRRWAPFCLQHPQIFRPRTLAALLKECDFEVDRIQKTRNWLSPRQAAALLHSIGLAPEAAVRFLPDWSLPVPLGNVSASACKVQLGS